MKTPFKFISPGKLVDRDLELVLVKTTPADPIKGYVPAYEFEMRRPGRSQVMGTIRLRIGSTRKLRYPGHIGYQVKKRFRGYRYAARSCRLLLPLALAHGLKAVWLTVTPRNTPSLRTCEIIGAKYVDTVRIPKEHEMYTMGERYKRRYRLDTRTETSNPVDIATS
jgi:predicted acetyltransferase